MYPISSIVQEEVLTKTYIESTPGGMIRLVLLPALPEDEIPLNGKIPSFGSRHLQVIKEPTSDFIPAPTVRADVSFIDFALQDFRRKTPVSDKEMANYKLPLTPVERAIRMLKANREVTQEVLLMTAMTTTASYESGYEFSASAKFDTNTADPRKEIGKARRLIGSNNNIAVGIGWDTYDALLKVCQDELLSFKEDPLELQALARYLRVAECVIADGKYDDGSGTGTDFIWPTTEMFVVERPATVEGEVSGGFDNGFGFSCTKNEKITTPRIPGEDPEGYNVIAHGTYANALLQTSGSWTKAVRITDCL